MPVVKTDRSDALYSYIYDKCAAGKPGFYPFEIPTGHGKTTAMLSVITDLSARDDNYGRKFFVASAKLNNLNGPYEDLCRLMPADEVLFLKSIPDAAVDFYNSGITPNKTVAESAEYKDFHKAVENYVDIENLKNAAKNDNSLRKKPNLADACNDAKNKISDKQSSLRRFIANKLNEKIEKDRKEGRLSGSGFIRDADRAEYVKKHKTEWGFLYDLFPSMRIPNAKAIFLSVDKLAVSLKSPTQTYRDHLYNQFSGADGAFRNSVLFLDESDEDFRQFRSSIIDNAAKGNTDIIQMIREVYTPRVYKKKDFEDAAGTSKEECKEFYNELLKRVFKKYHLGYTFQTCEEMRNNSGRTFLFKPDIEAHFNIEDCLFVHFDGTKNIIYRAKIRTDKNGDRDGYEVRSTKDVKLSKIAYDVYHFLIYDTTSFIRKLTMRYLGKHSLIEFADAATSVMSMMEIKNEVTQDFILTNLGPKTSDEIHKKSMRDTSFYENGTASAIMLDAASHNEDTEVRFYVITTTPEKIVADMAEQVQVWGISATSLNESVIMNGNMSWIETRLGNKFCPPAKNELEHIKKEAGKNWDFTGVRYNVDIIHHGGTDATKKQPISTYAARQLNEFFSEELSSENRSIATRAMSVMNDIRNTIVLYIRDDDEDNKKGESKSRGKTGTMQLVLDRYLEVLSAWRMYITHTDADSALFFGNSYLNYDRKGRKAEAGSTRLDWNTLKECADLISSIYDYDGKFETEFVHIKNDDLKEKKDATQEILDNAFLDGERRFVYTIYKAAGTGQNLQHKYKDGSGLVKVSKNRPGNADGTDEKDYDMIFLSAPTNIIQNIYGSAEDGTGRAAEKGMISLLFQLMSLSDAYSGEVALWEAAKILEAKSRNDFHSGRGLKGRDSEIYGAFNVMVQAIGRIGRSAYRSRNVYIGLSSDAAKAFALVDETQHYFSHEVTEVLGSDIIRNLYNQMKTENDSSGRTASKDEMILKARNVVAHGTIERSRKRTDTQGFIDMEGWEDIREAALRNVRTKEDWKALGNAGQIMYYSRTGLVVKEGEYSYSISKNKDDDYRNVKISFNPAEPLPLMITSESTRLADILLIKGVRQYFEDHGYRLTLDMENYILPPVVVHNIFMGAIAEVAGTYAINEDAKSLGNGVSLADIKDPYKYELFDRVIDGTDVYIDFKNFAEGNRKTDEEILHGERGGIEKAKACGAKTIIYIQMTAHEKHEPTDKMDSGIRVIQLPGMYTIIDGVAVRNDRFFDILYKAARG